MKLIKNGNIRGIDMTEQDLKIQNLKEENKKLKEEIQKYEQSMERILERLEGKSRFYNSASAIDQNIRRGVKESINIVKEVGGINDRK